MKLTIGNNNFTDIGTAVFYTQQDLDNRTYSKVQYKSNSSLLYQRDFSEYNFSYEVEKGKFNDEFLVDYLGEKTLNLFEPSSNALEKLESIIFPTLGDEEWKGPENKYFGTTIINNQLFALFHADSLIKKVELYNGIIYKNNNNSRGSDFISIESLIEQGNIPIEEPYFIIDLGVPGVGEIVEDTDLVRQRELEDEVEFEKMIWLLISSNNEISGINLSYKSWVDSINPNRNMNKYLLRNDEFWSTKDYIKINKVIEDTGNNIVLDSNSGTLLGTEKVDESKLLAFNKIKERINSCKYSEGQEYPNYFPYTTYKRGDKVVYGNAIWESLTDNNFNSNPVLSSKWIKSEVIEENRSIKVIVTVTPEDAGYCEPMGVISLPSLDTDMTFKILPGAGYKLNELQPCLLDQDKIVILSDDNYDYSVPSDMIIMHNWRDVISTNKLVFNLKSIGSNIKFVAEYNGEDVSYSNWVSTFNESNFTVYRLVEIDLETGISYTIDNPLIDSEGNMGVTTGKEIKLYFKEFTSYTIQNVEVEFKESVNSDPITTYITPETTEDRESIITIPEVNFSEAIFRLILTQKQVTASIIEFSGFEISNYSIRTVSGNSVTFRFIDNEYQILSDGSKVLMDNLKEILLNDSQGNSLTIERYTTRDVPLSFGYSTVYYSRVDQPIGSVNYGEYTLRINNLCFDTTIQILRK